MSSIILGSSHKKKINHEEKRTRSRSKSRSRSRGLALATNRPKDKERGAPNATTTANCWVSNSRISTCSSSMDLPPLVIFLCSLMCLVQWSTAEHVILSPLEGKPPNTNEKEIMMILIPEQGVPNWEYIVFGRIIQQLYPIRMSVGVIDTSQEKQLTFDNLPLLLAEVKQQLSSLPGSSADSSVFLAAHGQQGSLAADYARAVPESLQGLILYGAFLPKRWSVVSFPLPVLTISGDLDGVTRMTRIAEAIRHLMTDAEFDPAIVTHSPLILLEGGNHNSYTTGRLPEGLHLLDIEEEVDKSVSMETAANMTSLFIARTLEYPAFFVPIAQSAFRDHFEYAKRVTEPIRSLREWTQDNYKSHWVKFAQKWLSGLAGKDSSHLEVTSYVAVDDETLPPALIMEDGITYVVTFSEIKSASKEKSGSRESTTMSDDEDDNATAPQAPGEIAARMLGPERIQKFMKNTTIAHNYTCRDLNYCSFMTAYHSASEMARKRFDSYKRSVIFAPDVITDSEKSWINTSLKISMQPGEIHVTSIAYKTPSNESEPHYSGLFFCKLLPPDRALEWIYVDALRRNLPLKR